MIIILTVCKRLARRLTGRVERWRLGRLRNRTPFEQATIRSIRAYYHTRCLAVPFSTFEPLLGTAATYQAAAAVCELITAWIQGYRRVPMIATPGKRRLTGDELRVLTLLDALTGGDAMSVEPLVGQLVVPALQTLFIQQLWVLSGLKPVPGTDHNSRSVDASSLVLPESLSPAR